MKLSTSSAYAARALAYLARHDGGFVSAGAIAAAEGRAPMAVADEWFARYVSILITPLLWLDAEYGVTLEAHQQNTLVQLDQRGYPAVGWYRDNQGFYYRESRIAELEALGGLPGLGRASDTVVPDRVVTERLLYYVGINNLMGVAGAFGCAGLADEYRLGLASEGWKQIEAVYRRGDLSAPRVDTLWPAGRKYLSALRSFLEHTGYAR